MIRIVTIRVLVLAATVLADDYEQRSKLTGSWQIETTDAKEASAWILQPCGFQRRQDVDGIRLQDGAGVHIKDSGHHAKVTMYSTGQVGGDGNHRIARSEAALHRHCDGNTMELEVIPIEPEGRSETIVFKRVAAK
jgi:hypothetical protein